MSSAMPTRPGRTGPRGLVLGLMLSLGALPVLAGGDETAVPVQVRPLQALLFEPERRGPAEVLSLAEADLAAEVAGRVAEVLVEVGEAASAGNPLLKLDCRHYELVLRQRRAGLAAARASRDFAAAQLSRARALAGRDISAELKEQRQLEEAAAQAEVQRAEAALGMAGLDVERCTLVAPADGWVSERRVSVGDWLGVGSPALTFTAGQAVEVQVDLPAAQAGELLGATRVWLEQDGRRTPLQVRAALPRLDPATRNRSLRLACSQPCALLPGSAGEVVWVGEPRLPAELLEERGGRTGIFVRSGDLARFVTLPDAQRGRPLRPPPGLTGETSLIVEGRQRLRDGMAIVPAP